MASRGVTCLPELAWAVDCKHAREDGPESSRDKSLANGLGGDAGQETEPKKYGEGRSVWGEAPLKAAQATIRGFRWRGDYFRLVYLFNAASR